MSQEEISSESAANKEHTENNTESVVEEEKTESVDTMTENENKKRKAEDESSTDDSRKIAKVVRTVRVLCPTYCVGSVLGKGGEKIKELKHNTGAKIQISKPNSFFPGTNERVISVLADCERLKEIIRYIQDKIRDDNSNKTPDSRAENRKKVCKLVVADGVLGKIIGKGGERINELKANHDVFIKTTNKKDVPHNLQERVIYVEGERDNMEACVHEILDEIHEDRRSALDFHIEYEMYSTSATSGGGGGSNGPKNGSDHPGYPSSYDRGSAVGSYSSYSSRGYGAYSGSSGSGGYKSPYGYPMSHPGSYYPHHGYAGSYGSYGYGSYSSYGSASTPSSHDRNSSQYRTGGAPHSSYYGNASSSQQQRRY